MEIPSIFRQPNNQTLPKHLPEEREQQSTALQYCLETPSSPPYKSEEGRPQGAPESLWSKHAVGRPHRAAGQPAAPADTAAWQAPRWPRRGLYIVCAQKGKDSPGCEGFTALADARHRR